MGRRIVYQIDSFTKERFRGNPAGVVLNADGLDDGRMQAVARELNNSETAFLFPPEADDCDAAIRYFTPKTEVPTCGHATIAALYALALENRWDSRKMRIRTRIGVLPMEVIARDGDWQVVMTQGPFELGPAWDAPAVGTLIEALGLDGEDLDLRCPVQIASTGHAKVMIGLRHRERLDRLAPRLDALAALSGRIGCNGYFVFTFDSGREGILTCGRMFAPAIGINEDPVTGNANGPLGGYLVKNRIVPAAEGWFEFSGRQGESIGRPGVVHVRVKVEKGEPVLVQIRGEAVSVFRAEIEA